MTIRFFSDWRNWSRPSEPDLPPRYEADFRSLPRSFATDREYAYWESAGALTGARLVPVHGTDLSWSDCPSVYATMFFPWQNATYWDREREFGNKSVGDRLSLLNNGTHIGTREVKSVLHRVDNWNRCNAVVSQLELTPHQKLRVHHLLENLDLDKLGMPIEFIVFILSALVCREDGRQFTTHPSSTHEDSLFTAFAAREGFRIKPIRSWLKRLAQHPDIRGKLHQRPKRRVPAPRLEPAFSPSSNSQTVKS